MTRRPMIRAAAIAAALGLAVSGCAGPSGGAGGGTGGSSSQAESSPTASASPSMSGMEGPVDGGPAPAGITPAADPKYPVGTAVTPTADHMPGMDGASATVSGAFDTTAYAINYTPTNGDQPVENHKWVVQEEIEDPGPPPLSKGTEVVVNADHMPGLQGATATIVSSTDETVYMVDVTMNGTTMTNHKWVVESEMQPAD